MSTTLIVGSARITAAGAIVAGSNSGAIQTVLHNGDGDDTITLDDDSQIGAGDTVDITVEEAVAGLTAVERLSTTQFRVRLLDAGAVALAADYGLTIKHTLVG